MQRTAPEKLYLYIWNIADSSILEIITESGDGSSIQLKGLNPGITVVTAASNDAVTTRTVEVLGNSGQCGETATWDLTDGVLTISGTGAITNPAWLQMRENITSVEWNVGYRNL